MIDQLLIWIHDYCDWAWAIAALVAFTESLIIIGFFFPGWVLLLALGGLIGAQVLPFWPIFFGAYSGAVLGEGLGFTLGFTHSEKIRQSRFLQKHGESVLRAENLFLRFGALSLIAGRFVGPVRAVLPFIAGFLNFSPLRYWLINLVTAVFLAFAYLMPGIISGAATQFNAAELAPVLGHLVGIALLLYGSWHWRAQKKIALLLLFTALLLSLLFAFVPWASTAVAWWQLITYLTFNH